MLCRQTTFNFYHFYIFPTVKSYGTEDRHTDRPAPPKDDIYEYIIFRGSDIKDITVSEPPKPHHGLPRDPAIVQVCNCPPRRGNAKSYITQLIKTAAFAYLWFQSSVGNSSAGYHPRWSSYRDMMPTYNQLAATSLLNQQYNAALGLGAADASNISVFLNVDVADSHSAVDPNPSCTFLLPPVPGIHGIPARRAPMVEQAVQTVPLVSASQKRGKTLTQPPASKPPVRPNQRAGPAQKENVPTSEHA